MLLNAFVEIIVSIDWDYSPSEPPTRDHPGCHAELNLTSVIKDGKEIIEMLADDEIEYLEDQAMAHVESMNDPDNQEC